MATEEQTDVRFLTSNVSGGVSWGQRLTISDRTVSKLSFYLRKIGSPSGTVTFFIRKLDDSIVASKLWGNSSDISTTPAWYEVTFDTPVYVNEEVYLLVRCTGGSAGNVIQIYSSFPDDVKADEFIVQRTALGVYKTYVDFGWDPVDFGYIYTYGVSVAPTVTTQAATNIGETTATANGNITDLGSPNPTAHGFAYSPTDTTPDIETDSVTDEGAASSTGAFTSDLTGLTAGLLYYVRAYATNTAGTSYGSVVTVRGIRAVGAGYVWQDGPFVHFGGEDGNEVIYNPPLTVSGSEDPGYLWTEGTELNVIDSAGDERSEEGTATGDTGPEGAAFIEGSELHYLDETAGAERTH